MADSIHDQWNQATQEWQTSSSNFNQAWNGVSAAYDVNVYYAWFSSAIGWAGRMHEDTTVMAGNMITHIAQTGQDTAKGTIENFQHLNKNVLPAWGALAAAYAEARAQAWAAHEAANRVSADDAERAARAAADLAGLQAMTSTVNKEAATRSAGDTSLLAALNSAIAAEAVSRAAGDDHTRQQLAAAIAALHDQLAAQIDTVLKYAQSLPGLVDQRAAAGYDPTLRARGGLVNKLLDTVVAHNPAVSSLVTNLAKFAIDLAGVEDPVLKIAAQLVLKQVIDRLGLNSALTAMLNDLLGGIIGGGQPKTLQDIMGDIGNRLDALEAGQAELSPLAPEADDLHEMGTVLFDAALLGYFAAAVADPVATANDTVDVIGAVAGPLLAPVRALLGMP